MGTIARGATAARAAPLSGRSRISAWPQLLFSLILDWQDRSRQRYLLQTYDDHMLRDIGLSRADVAREAGKPFWRA
jgi:uncharacterized protein YjiS (DUF1127 family)